MDNTSNSNTYDTFMKSLSSYSSYTEDEKKHFRSIIEASPVRDSEKLTPAILKGQYRMSFRLLERLFKQRTKNVKTNADKDTQKKRSEERITKQELLLLILLLQLCDSNNKIHDFSYTKDIEPLTDFNGDSLFKKSTYYYAISSLERKEILKRQEEENGMVTLTISANQINKNERYITLQTEFLLHDSEQYLAFRDMKLASIKIYLLYLSSTYRGRNSSGKAILDSKPEFSINELKTRLGIKQNRTIRAYIKSLESAFGHITLTPGGGRKSFLKGLLQMSNMGNKFCFAKRTVMTETQPNSFRRHFDKAFHNHDISCDKEHYAKFRTWFFMILEARKEDIDTEKLFSFIIEFLSERKKLDMLTFSEIGKIIANA